MTPCRICAAPLDPFLDLGKQPLSDAFVTEDKVDDEFFFELQVARCPECTMTQLLNEVPRERMFHADYPYRSSGSTTMTEHFRSVARHFLDEELGGADPFIVEIGSNDGVMLRTVADAGIAHLGVDPSSAAASVAAAQGVDIRMEFFEFVTAESIRREFGPANVIYAANTMCHIPYLDSVFSGALELLSEDGIFVFEDPYIGDILTKLSFDQIYDEHFYFFSGTSVDRMSRRFGLELVDVERLDVHGGEMRYTLARPGRRTVSARVTDLLNEELGRGLDRAEPYRRFADGVQTVGTELRALLGDLRAQGHRVVGYGATAKSATVNNYCGIDSTLVSCVYDTTPEKQGRLTPGQHIPVVDMADFAEDPSTHVLLYAWNHAAEITSKETEFARRGGRWITYVPRVEVS